MPLAARTAAAPRRTLSGRRGWTMVAALAAVLVGVSGVQVQAAGTASAGVEALPEVPAAATKALPERDRPVADLVTARAETARADADAARAAAEQAAAEQARVAAEQAAAAQASRSAADRCSGEGWQQRRGEAALASLAPGATASGFRVEFAAARSGYLGLTYLERGLVEVFVRDCRTQSDELLRHVIAHELGHAYDTARLDDATRAAWKAARGIPASTPWYGCSGCSDFATPAGDFAEVYAQRLRGAGQNRSELAGDVAPGELQELAARFFGA